MYCSCLLGYLCLRQGAFALYNDENFSLDNAFFILRLDGGVDKKSVFKAVDSGLI